MEPRPVSEAIIADHVVYSMGAAMIPLPLADVAAVTLVQLDMVRELAGAYDIDYDRARGKALILSLSGAAAARIGASALKALPFAGTLIGAAAQVGLSGASTYAVGQVFMSHFEERGSFEDMQPEALRERYRYYVDKGKEIARALRDTALPSFEPSVEEIADTLERLGKLRDAGVLEEDEFRRLKAEALGGEPS